MLLKAEILRKALGVDGGDRAKHQHKKLGILVTTNAHATSSYAGYVNNRLKEDWGCDWTLVP